MNSREGQSSVRASIKRLISAFSLFFVVCVSHGQVIHIDAEKKVKDDAFEKSQSILPVYKSVSDRIEPYVKLFNWFLVKRVNC